MVPGGLESRRTAIESVIVTWQIALHDWVYSNFLILRLSLHGTAAHRGSILVVVQEAACILSL